MAKFVFSDSDNVVFLRLLLLFRQVKNQVQPQLDFLLFPIVHIVDLLMNHILHLHICTSLHILRANIPRSLANTLLGIIVKLVVIKDYESAFDAV